ncbi:MAG: fatty-acid--CoA ligase [Acidobacteria bacterium]|nr:fatty-acid--CoA ligase [Acidobacteriota bacterium]
MMKSPLSLSVLMDRAPKMSPGVEIVTRFRDRIHRTNYGEVGRRARQLANALTALGVEPGDRIGSFGWNTSRHLELYYAIPSMGAVLHTLNLRLSAADLEYIINHAEDRIIFVDEDLLPLLERLAGRIPTVKQIVVMSNTSISKILASPSTCARLNNWLQGQSRWLAVYFVNNAYSRLLTAISDNPKTSEPKQKKKQIKRGLDRQATVLAVVPMFHANAWGMPFTALMLGIKQVYPGAMMDGASICQLIQDEKVTFTAGVPTIWLGVMNELRNNPGKYDLSSLRTMVCGGSAPPRALIDWFETNLGVEFIQAWGMTETSPLGTVSRLKPHMLEWPRERQLDVKQRAGLCAPGLELRIVDGENNDVAHDGVSMGRLLIRGPWIASTYYREEPTEDKFPGGWLDTGDVATIDSEGYMSIADRSKDLIKSGGEWISSVDLENAIMAIPGVAEAAVIAVFHPKWQERPLACVVTQPGQSITREEILARLEKQFAKWWMPDEIIFIESIPKTSVGKFDKKVLRQQFADFELPG